VQATLQEIQPVLR
jgi:hypothetical protein